MNAPCACPCRCRSASGVPVTGSPVLDGRARCRRCQSAAHQEAHPLPAARPARTVTRTLSEPTREERALDRQIARQQQHEIARQEWDRWQASLPERFRNATTDHAAVQSRLERLRLGEYGSAGMVVCGPPGIGKTWIAVGYANAAIQKGLVKPREVLFGTEAELLASAANSAFGEVETALRRLTSRQHRMIVIDDVGRGTWLREDMCARVFSLVLDAAWRDNRVLVVTTNLNQVEIDAYIGASAMDRLRSMSGYHAVILDQRDMRRITTQQRIAAVSSSLRTPAPQAEDPR